MHGEEVAASNIRVNTICPDLTDTDMAQGHIARFGMDAQGGVSTRRLVRRGTCRGALFSGFRSFFLESPRIPCSSTAARLPIDCRGCGSNPHSAEVPMLEDGGVMPRSQMARTEQPLTKRGRISVG